MPTPTKYTYSIVSDFSAGVSTDALQKSVQVDASISIALDRIETAGDNCDIWFRDVLPAGEVTALGVIVAAHDGQPLPQGSVDADGNQIVRLASANAAGLPSISVQDFDDAMASYRRSWLIECPANTITLRDICISNDLIGPTGVCRVASSKFAVASDSTHPNGAALGCQLQVDLIDRDDLLGYFVYYGAHRSKLAGLTNMSQMLFSAGEQIRSATCRAKVLSVGSDFLEITFDRWNADGEMANFSPNEVITGQTSGATATLSATPFTEGDFVSLQKFIKSEALYRFKEHEQKPGGSREVPPGLYFRCAIFNSHPTDPMWLDGSIDLGKM